MADILRQVDEDLRKDKLLSVWKFYRFYIIGFILIILISLAGYQYYIASEQSKNEEIVQKYVKALNSENVSYSVNQLIELDKSKNSYINGLAKLKRAELYLTTGERNMALELLESTFKNESLDKIIRDLAIYKYLMIQLDSLDKKTYFEIIESEQLKESKFKYLFKELKAIKYLIDGDRINSLEIFESIISDENSPVALKTRAEKFKKISR